jgi:hypothetical protein
LDHS